MKLSVLLIVKNEEKNIPDCLSRLSWADEILIVDSGSTDQTIPLAQQRGAKVISHPFKDFASQRNFALTQASGDWIFFVDADERVTPELEMEIRDVIHHQVAPKLYAIPRRTYFFGHRLHFSDTQNDAPIRLFPKGCAEWMQPVHETLRSSLPVQCLKSPLLHFSTRDRAHYEQKLEFYIPLELLTMEQKKLRPSRWDSFLRPLAKFFYLYLIRLGILDGIPGLQYAILSAYYTFLKYSRYCGRKRGS